MGDTERYGSASTPDSVTEKAVHQPGSDSQNGVWRDRQHRHWERSATGMYPLTTAIQYAENIIIPLPHQTSFLAIDCNRL